MVSEASTWTLELRPRQQGRSVPKELVIQSSDPALLEKTRTLLELLRAVVLDTVDEQLMYQPTVETRNRKPMRPNPMAPWELRIGKLRVYYDIEEGPEMAVYIRAVGIKERNRVSIAGEVFEL